MNWVTISTMLILAALLLIVYWLRQMNMRGPEQVVRVISAPVQSLSTLMFLDTDSYSV